MGITAALSGGAPLLLGCDGPRAPETPGPSEPGPAPEPCGDEGSCGAGKICSDVPYQGGVVPSCVEACDVAEDGCPPGTFCDELGRDPARGVCTPRCQGDGECGEGLSCDERSGRCVCSSDAACNDRLEPRADERPFVCHEGSCTHSCRESADCPCGSICDEGACVIGCGDSSECCGTSRCEEGRCTPPEAAPDGSHCNAPEDCDSGLCLTSVYSRGLCVSDVVRECVPGACVAGMGCGAVYIPWIDEMVGVCAPGCGEDSDCPTGTSCELTVEVAGAPGRMACLPTCSGSSDCGPHERCDEASSTCGCADDQGCKVYGAAAKCETSQCVCDPDCEGRSCGDDGCGGSCGTCEAGFRCGEGGVCAGVCGESTPFTVCPGGGLCPPNSTCAGQSCRCDPGYQAQTCSGIPCPDCGGDWRCGPCTPSCEGKMCGDDGCGGSCGSCGLDMACAEDGSHCLPTGGGGDPSCPGGCPAGSTCTPPFGCSSLCRTNLDCGTGCCRPLLDGKRVCSPPQNCEDWP